MPLSEKARVEVYVPDLPLIAYNRLLKTLETDSTYLFGGCTLQRRLDGNYLSQAGEPVPDRVNLIYTDAPFSFSQNLSALSAFADELRAKAEAVPDEEAILAVVMPLCHSE